MPEKHNSSPEMTAYYEEQRQELEARVAKGKLKKITATNGVLYISTLGNGQQIGFAASTPELVIMTDDIVYLERNVPDEQFIGKSRIINGTSHATAIVNGFRINLNPQKGQPVIDFESLTEIRNHLPKTLGFNDVVSNQTAIKRQRMGLS